MKEEFLHFVWQKRRFNQLSLQTVDAQSIEILDTGTLNNQDGPDFLNARIKIGDAIWAGHVEIHLQSSDWIKHKHKGNPHYKNIILHVVYRHDLLTDIAGCPTLELAGLIPRSVYERYLDLMESPSLLPCHHLLSEMSEFDWLFWKERLLIERMEQKVKRIESIFEENGQNWEQTAFVLFLRYFGTGVNSDNFQELGMRIPFTHLAKIAHEPKSVEALLFGTAGFLNGTFEDEYPKILQEEYKYLAHKWKLKAMPAEWWRWKQTRPATFPSVRLAQLAAVLPHVFPLMEKLIQPNSLEDVFQEKQTHPYWHTHYRFDQPSQEKPKPFTQDFVHQLQINVSAPLMIAHARKMGSDKMLEDAFELLRNTSPEQNKITRAMQSHGFHQDSAFDSQALMHLKSCYCDVKKCLDCAIGVKILDAKANNSVISGLNLMEDEAYI